MATQAATDSTPHDSIPYLPKADTQADRLYRIMQIRKAIEAGRYDTPERLEAAMDAMLSLFDRSELG